MAPPTVLVVDDEPRIREVVRFALEKEGFDVHEARDGREGLERFAQVAPDLVVLDILMPEMDGVELCREIRADSRVPIVFLSSKDEEIDRILGLELGGDDYVTKPFSPRELAARCKAVLRRTLHTGEAEAGEEEVLRHGRLRLDAERHEAFWDEAAIPLTVTEFGILRALARRPGRVYSRDELMDLAYREHTVVSERTIDSHVRRLRKKLALHGADPVETVRGVGYRLGSCA